jgi:hypothetical protein
MWFTHESRNLGNTDEEMSYGTTEHVAFYLLLKVRFHEGAMPGWSR